ncbi:MAG: hypothetical protein SFV15_00765 [Polyangiaceae bacterium]|nr:hypothetical protein [Polyangiaceae bacterium]
MLGPTWNVTLLRHWALWVVTAAALTVSGCPGKSVSKKVPEPCKKLGQVCEFTAGKLGACAYKPNCAGADCYYCQSQH